MKKYFPLFAFIILLILPWTHWVLFHNVMLAFPNSNPTGVHWGVALASVVAILIIDERLV